VWHRGDRSGEARSGEGHRPGREPGQSGARRDCRDRGRAPWHRGLDRLADLTGVDGLPVDGSGNVVAVAVAKLDLMTVVENWGVVPENTNLGVKSTVVVNLLQSNNVKLRAPNTKTVPKTTLGKSMSDATYYLSCWMTMAQIEKLRTEKVMFSSFD
jgi:hypothetical protein